MPLSPFQKITIRKCRAVVISSNDFRVDSFPWVTNACVAGNLEAPIQGQTPKFLRLFGIYQVLA